MTQRTTSNHGEIQRWAQERGGQPAVIDHPNARADKPGIRIDFPGKRDDAIKDITHPVTWDEFFAVFEEQQLLLTYEDDPTDEDPEMWYHFELRVLPPEADEPPGNPPRDPEGDWPEGSESNPSRDET